MLKVLRHPKVQKKIYLILAVIIVITFGISGVILTQEKHNPASSLGKIHGHSVTVQEFLASYKAIGHQAQLIYGDSYQQIRPFINFKGEAWDRILLLNHAKKENIRTSDKEVVQWIGRQSFFMNKNGFDHRLYGLILERVLQTDARRFEEEIRQMLTIGKIREKIRARVTISDDELDKLYAEEIEAVRLREEKAKAEQEAKPAEVKAETAAAQEVKPAEVKAETATAQEVKGVPAEKKKTTETKEEFRIRTLEKRADKEMDDLLAKLRKDLVPNLELMKQIFPEDETPASQTAPQK